MTLILFTLFTMAPLIVVCAVLMLDNPAPKINRTALILATIVCIVGAYAIIKAVTWNIGYHQPHQAQKNNTPVQ